MRDIDSITKSFLNNEVQLFCFRLEKNGDYFAVNIYKVREVIKYTGHVTLVEHADNSMLEGIVTIRDETIPLIDIRKWLYYDTTNPNKSLVEFGIKSNNILIMVCDFSDFIVGIRIYEADRIITRKWTEINQNSEFKIKSGNNKITANTKYLNGEILQIVDVERMLVDVFPWLHEQKEQELHEVKEVKTNKLVLLAEDSPSAMKMMKMILEKLSVRYIDFKNGKLLLDYVFSHDTNIDRIGLVITDLEMPEASGFEVIKQLKNHPKTKHIPIVVNSSMSGDSNKNMAKKLNADGFVSKSNPKEIEQMINELMIQKDQNG